MKITNTHKTEVCLPNGVFLKPNVPTTVPDWPEISQNLVVKAWVRAKILVTDDSKSEPVKQGSSEEGDEKDQLIAELATFGIEKNRRSSEETLRALLDEAKANAEKARG
jgi:hypothetical protein